MPLTILDPDPALILFLVFLAAYMLSQFFRAFLAVIAPGLAAELALTASDLANMSAAWFAVFAIAQFPLGIALDRIGPRSVVPTVMLAGVGGALALALAQGAWGCILALALIGLGCSPIYMGALYYYGRTVSPQQFGFTSACLLGFGSIGNLLAATPLAWASQTIGWRLTIVGVGVLMLLAAALFWALVRDPPVAVRPKARVSAIAELREIVTLPGFWTLMPLIALGYATLVVERGLWVGPYLAEVHRLSPVPLGNAVLGMAVAMSIGALAFGALDRMSRNSKMLVIGGTTMQAAGFAYLAAVPQPSLATAVVVMAFIGFMGLCQPLLFAHARHFFPEHLLGRGITFANFLTIGGSGVVQFGSGAYVASLQAAGSPPSGVYASLHLMLAGLVVAALAIYLLSPRAPGERPGAH